MDITAPTPQPTSLHDFLKEARELDASVSQAAPETALVTWGLTFVRDLGGEDDHFFELDVVAPAASNEACRLWLNDLTSWLEDNQYAYAVSHWNRYEEPTPHASIQGALNDLADQMTRTGLVSHPWAGVMRQGVAVAHAQTREQKTSPLDPKQASNRRPRHRP